MTSLSYSGYRFPRDIIQRAVWMYLRFTLSFRDVEECLVERGIETSYESIRRWVLTFGPVIACRRSPLPRDIEPLGVDEGPWPSYESGTAWAQSWEQAQELQRTHRGGRRAAEGSG